MRPERMLAFSDGVIAILITILVLELRPPAGDHLADILDEKSKLLAYLLSFLMVGIYWNNHHHLMQVVQTIDGRTLWANMHLLFWLSLMPLGTAWLGEQGVEPGPVAAYAIVLLGCAIAFMLLTLALLAIHESGSQLAQAIGSDRKGRISLVLYILALALAGVFPWGSIAIFVAVAFIWFLPDRRVERVVGSARGCALAQAGAATTRSDSVSGSSTTSPGRSLRPRRPSGSPLTTTASVPIRFFASPPVSTMPASCSSWPRPMNSPVTSTSRTGGRS